MTKEAEWDIESIEAALARRSSGAEFIHLAVNYHTELVRALEQIHRYYQGASLDIDPDQFPDEIARILLERLKKEPRRIFR